MPTLLPLNHKTVVQAPLEFQVHGMSGLDSLKAPGTNDAAFESHLCRPQAIGAVRHYAHKARTLGFRDDMVLSIELCIGLSKIGDSVVVAVPVDVVDLIFRRLAMVHQPGDPVGVHQCSANANSPVTASVNAPGLSARFCVPARIPLPNKHARVRVIKKVFASLFIRDFVSFCHELCRVGRALMQKFTYNHAY